MVLSGKLAKKNRVVYKHLYHKGPETQKKTERFFNDRTYTLRPRFAQLERMGLITVAGEIKCEETGRKNLLWDVTDRVDPLELKGDLRHHTKYLLSEKSLELYDEADVFLKDKVAEIIRLINKL